MGMDLTRYILLLQLMVEPSDAAEMASRRLRSRRIFGPRREMPQIIMAHSMLGQVGTASGGQNGES